MLLLTFSTHYCFFITHKAIPFFLRLASNAFPDIGSVGQSDWKKKHLPKKNHKKSRNRRPWYPGTTLKVNFHITGLTKCTICCKKCSCFSPCCYYDNFSDRLKELLFQVKNGLTTWLLFFCENAKNLGRSDDAKRRKKRRWPKAEINDILTIKATIKSNYWTALL